MYDRYKDEQASRQGCLAGLLTPDTGGGWDTGREKDQSGPREHWQGSSSPQLFALLGNEVCGPRRFLHIDEFVIKACGQLVSYFVVWCSWRESR